MYTCVPITTTFRVFKNSIVKGIFEKNKNLLTQKCFEYFGHKLTFSCVVREDSPGDAKLYNAAKEQETATSVSNKTTPNKLPGKNKKTDKSSPHVKAIIDELGGEEIYR